MQTRSDHCGELIKRRSAAKVVGAGFDAEFVVAAAKVRDERVTRDDRRRVAVGLQSPIGRSLAFSRPWSHSTGLFAYFSMLRNACGNNSSIAIANAAALSVTTFAGSPV